MTRALHAFVAGMGNPQLRRAQIAFAAACAAEWAFTVALSVVAYRDGGAAAVGLVALLRMLPSALLAPAIGAYSDRIPRERVLIASCVARAGATLLAALALAVDGPIAVVYGLAVLSTVAMTPFRAAHTALLPSLCATATELTSTNVVRGMLDSLSLLLGPLAAAALLEWTSAEAAFAATAAAAGAAALVLAGLRYEAPPRAPAAPDDLRAELAEGLRAVRVDRDLRLLFWTDGVQTLTRGALTVLTVVMAIDLLGLGEKGVGLLTAAMGAGAVLGSLGASLLVGRSLPRAYGLSVALWGGPLVLVAAVPEQWAALLALGLIGVANAVLDVGLYTMLSRLAPDAVLGRVGAVLEAQVALTVGLGSILAPLAVELAGDRGALAVVGVLGPLAALAAQRPLRRLEQRLRVRDGDLAALRGVALLRVLPMATLEDLASRAQRGAVAAGDDVVRIGEAGDTYYVIAAGEAEAYDQRRVLRAMHAGDGFGEIALLRDVPRTASVRARTDLDLLCLSRSDFLIAVGGYSSAAAAAAGIADERLARSALP